MKTSIKPVFENHTVRPSSLWDLGCSQWIHINKKYYVQRVTDNGLITSVSFFPSFIKNKQITVTCEEGHRDFQVPELPDSHASRSRMTPEAVGSTSLAFPDVAAPSKRNHTVQAQWATHVGWALPEENIDFGETFPFFSAFWTLCFLRRGPPQSQAVPAEAVPTVQGGWVNQDVVTAVAGKFPNRNPRAAALERVLFLRACHVQTILRRLFHLLANSGIHRHRKFQTQKTAAKHREI